MATCCSVGAQPDGAERVDPQVPPRGPSARGRERVATAPQSAVSRRFVALSRKKMKLGSLGTRPASHPDGLHVGDHVLMAAIGVDGNGDKHVLAVVEGATEKRSSSRP